MGVVTAPILPPLLSCARDIERHVAAAGWDQPVRLFALVPTHDLRSTQPQLASALAQDSGAGPDAEDFGDQLSAVEQEDLPQEHSILDLLAQIGWPPGVHGAAIALERIVLPPSAQAQLPADDGEALAAVAEHPEREDVRLLVAVLRDGSSTCLLRQRSNDSDDRVALGQDIAPGLVAALEQTLSD
ncbi:MAG: PPA1309 family protein [Micrococcales bacterium]|nr:PPA1309 family protein [Micrococcales bacterium]